MLLEQGSHDRVYTAKVLVDASLPQSILYVHEVDDFLFTSYQAGIELHFYGDNFVQPQVEVEKLRQNHYGIKVVNADFDGHILTITMRAKKPKLL